MKHIATFIPALAVLFWLGEAWWLDKSPAQFWLIGLVMLVFSLLAAVIISRRAKEQRWWNAALLPFITGGVILGYTVIISSQWLINLLVIMVAILTYIYWRFVYFYYNLPSRYTSFSLENLSFYLNFLNVFFLGALAYGLRAFLQYNFWSVLAGVAVVLALILAQGMWTAKIDWRRYGWWWLAGLAVLLEFFSVLILLPLNHNLLGLLWASVYYLLLILFNDLMTHRFSRRRARLYLSLVAAVWLVLLLTASWL